MPITNRRPTPRYSSERAYQTFMDWMRKVLQVSAPVTALILGYLIYHLLMGVVPEWATLSAASRQQSIQIISSAVTWLNLSLAILLISLVVLFYDEEVLGYVLVLLAVGLYYGVPFLFDQCLASQVAEWHRVKNPVALAIYNELRFMGLVVALPGLALMLRDIVCRLAHGVKRDRDEFTAMQYGGSAHEEAPTGIALIGVLAKCSQMTFCREAMRVVCPIYLSHTRCWHERIGCMCEENVVRRAVDSVIHMDEPKPSEPVPAADAIRMADEPEPGPEKKPSKDSSDVTVEMPSRSRVPRGKVRIPHNTLISPAAKRARCRDCVIYNEHQRLKYQFFAPLVVLGVPALAWWQIDAIASVLGALLQSADRVMSRLSLDPNMRSTGIADAIPSSAQYIIIGCLVVIATTMALRFLETCTFKWKV